MHRIYLARRINHRTALGFGLGDGKKSVAQSLVKLLMEALEAIRNRGTPPYSCESVVNRYIENKCQIGREGPERQTL